MAEFQSDEKVSFYWTFGLAGYQSHGSYGIHKKENQLKLPLCHNPPFEKLIGMMKTLPKTTNSKRSWESTGLRKTPMRHPNPPPSTGHTHRSIPMILRVFLYSGGTWKSAIKKEAVLLWWGCKNDGKYNEHIGDVWGCWNLRRLQLYISYIFLG